jgi:hypothetical protein
MSMSCEISVPCGECRKAHPFTAWEMLNVTLDEEAKQRLLEGELTLFRCPD